jgi:hypothetical protein
VSYPGWLTVVAMLDPHPALKAVSPQASPADMFIGDDFHHNGAFRLSYGFEYAVMMETNKERAPFAFSDSDTYDWYLKLGSLAHVNEQYLHGTLAWNDARRAGGRPAFVAPFPSMWSPCRHSASPGGGPEDWTCHDLRLLEYDTTSELSRGRPLTTAAGAARADKKRQHRLWELHTTIGGRSRRRGSPAVESGGSRCPRRPCSRAAEHLGEPQLADAHRRHRAATLLPDRPQIVIDTPADRSPTASTRLSPIRPAPCPTAPVLSRRRTGRADVGTLAGRHQRFLKDRRTC